MQSKVGIEGEAEKHEKLVPWGPESPELVVYFCLLDLLTQTPYSTFIS